MPLVVDPASATITLSTGGAVPSVDVRARDPVSHSEVGICNLTLGYSSGIQAPAFYAVGKVKAAGSPSDRVGWSFGFIQIQKVLEGTATYGAVTAGNWPHSTTIDFGRPPALNQSVALDSVDRYLPWTDPDPADWSDGNQTAKTTMGDHPALKFPLRITNKITQQDVGVSEVIDRREFWTVLTARGPDSRFQHLCHFHWSLTYHYAFTWFSENAPPMWHGPRSRIVFDGQIVRGAPADPGVRAILANPGPPLANILCANAQMTAAMGGPPNRIDR